jgi:protein arginine kinase activator
MKCEACRKQEASVAFTHIVENQKQTLHLCPACIAARQAGSVDPTSLPPSDGAASENPADSTGRADAAAATRCPHCGMTYDEFRKGGRFGCPTCYEAFERQLDRLMKRIHGATVHRGKGLPPPRPQPQVTEDLAELRRQLAAAVAAEAYERAAEIRDRIRASQRRPAADAAR